MRIIAEIWGENIELAVGELRGILEGEGQEYGIVSVDYPVVVLDTENPRVLRRAGLLRRVSTHLHSGKDIPEMNVEMERYAIRVRGGNSQEIIKRVASGIRGNVDLENPKNVVRVYVGNEIHIGVEMFQIQGFEDRRSKNLPVSYPVTMHPRFARAMVNLARIKSGSTVLDPFCGTGVILIEAALAGMRVFGSDIDERMLHASEINLRKFGVEAQLQKLDVGEVEGRYDAIVTDPPYGRSASTSGESIERLYRRAFERFSQITDRVVISMPSEEWLRIGEDYFTLKEVYPIRVHKSLTRNFGYFHS